jgi:type IV pilus assembly protein PilO
MIDFNELQDIDIADLSSWPIWFRWIMIFLVAGGLLFASFKYIIEPEQKILAKLERTEKQLKKTYLSKKELVVNLPAYKQQMLEIQDRFGVVLQQLPDKTEVPALLIDITQAGLARGLRFEQFKPGETQTKEFYITLPISIIVSGTFHQMAEFVSDLASLPRIVTLGNVSLKRQKGRQLTMKAELFTYRYLEESNAKSKNKTVRVQG